MRGIFRQAKSILIVLLSLLLCGGCQTEPQVPEVIATIPTRGNPLDVAVNPRTGYVYALSYNHIIVLKGAEKVTELPGGEVGGLAALAVDEERGWVYAVNEYDDRIIVIRGTEVITTVETAGQAPANVTVEPQSGWAYVVSGYRKEADGIRRVVEGNVTVISGTQVIGAVPLGQVLATHVVADPVSGYVYVGCVSGNVIIIRGREETARFRAEATILAMDVDPRTGDVYVLTAYGELILFRKGERVAAANVEEDLAVQNMQVHPTTGMVYIVTVGGRVRVVREMEVVEEVVAGWGARKMAIDPVTGNVYVANFEDDTVTVIHGTEVLATIDVGWYPYGIGVNPVNGWVYVSNTNEHSVTVLGFRDEE